MPNEPNASATTRATDARATARDATTARFHGVRYQVKDVARSAAFYSRHLGFKVEHQQLPAFATLSLGPWTCSSVLRAHPGPVSSPTADGRNRVGGIASFFE
jgi:catechol 2,3-dioxygenase-like lactoylglutathione lyase family enzyme